MKPLTTRLPKLPATSLGLLVCCFAVLGVVALPRGADGQTSTGLESRDPSAAEILDLAAARSEAQAAAGIDSHYEADMRRVIDHVDSDGRVDESEESTYRRISISGAVYDELVSKDGRRLTEKEARQERERKEDFAREVRERIEDGLPPQPEDEQRVEFNREFISRYRVEIVGEEVLDGHDCWLLYIEPRAGDLPERTRMDKALNRSTGKVWVSKRGFGVPRVEFALDEPIDYLGGLLAKVRNTEGRIEFEQIAEDVWLPRQVEIVLDLRIFFASIRRNITMSWSDYQLADTTPEN